MNASEKIAQFLMYSLKMYLRHIVAITDETGITEFKKKITFNHDDYGDPDLEDRTGSYEAVLDVNVTADGTYDWNMTVKIKKVK